MRRIVRARSGAGLVASALLLLHAPVARAVPGLTTTQEIFIGAKKFSTIFVGDVAGSPDGTSVYVLDRERRQVRLFRRDAITGLLAQSAIEPVPAPPGESTLPGNLVVSPDGANVYLAKLTVEASLLGRHYPDLVWDQPTAQVLRSVVMKPEHLGAVDTLHAAVERVAATVV